MEFDLRATLNAFDGKHTDSLERIATRLPADKAVLDGLSKLALDDDLKLQGAATWLLKRYAEAGFTLDESQGARLLRVLKRDSHWEAKLHVLQMLDRLSVPQREAAPLWNKLAAQTEDPNRLIRAWSYHGIPVVADGHQQYRLEAQTWLSHGESDEAASVRARIRRLRKKYIWLRT